ncbi:DUF2490 domain-containing protein [Winogradskyella sp. 3972H.M.0a.05]|uniref:DUF2490 domain-containing protein n=1 Tax=Winogradskyella sp. 3972H.M.0a.05 TaxID=2950277 RepID=UPI0033962C69
MHAQSDFTSFGESEFAVNHKVSQDYKINFKLGTRYYLYRNDEVNAQFRQIDIAHFSTLSLTFNHSVSLGAQYRNRDWFEDSSNELRLTQQFNYTKKRFSKRFGHRIRLEERIFDASTTFRARYRFALDFPLNGERLDTGEAYMVSSMEALWSMNKLIAPELDHRTTIQVGYQLSKQFKIQAGVQYRFEALNIDTKQRLFILTSGILKI